jgi:hypothetical protein
VDSLGLNNTPCINFTLVKSRVKNIRPLKQGFSQSKMAGAGIHSFAILRVQIFSPVLADSSVYSADCHSENGHTADCQSQESEFASGLPQA